MRSRNVVPIAALAAAILSLPAAAKSPQETNKAVVRRAVDEIINKGDMKVAEQVYDASYVYHPDPTIKGVAGAQQLIGMYRTAFPDLHMTVDDLIAEGDRVVVRFTAKGTHKGALGDMPPTGKAVVVTGINIARLAGGKIVEEWENFDELGMMQQLGAIPQEGAAR